MRKISVQFLVFFGMVCFSESTCLADYNIRDYYFPLQVGNAWLYRQTVNTAEGDVTVQRDLRHIDDTEVVAGKQGYRIVGEWHMNFPQPEIAQYEVQAWEPDGLKLYRRVERGRPEGDNDEIFTPPVLLAPPRIEIAQRIAMAYGTVALEAVEKVEVPAGTFLSCLRISIQSAFDPCNSIMWLAPGIGVVKERETCTTARGTETRLQELLGARIGNVLHGNPVPEDRLISFALSSVQVQGCSILLDGIALRGYGELFWARFDLNLQSLAFELSAAGLGTQALPNAVCAFAPALSLPQEGAFLWDHAMGYFQTAAFFDAFLLEDALAGYAEFSFSEARLAFVLQRVWNERGEQIFP